MIFPGLHIRHVIFSNDSNLVKKGKYLQGFNNNEKKGDLTVCCWRFLPKTFYEIGTKLNTYVLMHR